MKEIKVIPFFDKFENKKRAFFGPEFGLHTEMGENQNILSIMYQTYPKKLLEQWKH